MPLEIGNVAKDNPDLPARFIQDIMQSLAEEKSGHVLYKYS
jgi:hypothetical protein